jgi:hypothetical protein
MNKNRIISGAVILIVASFAIVAWLHVTKTAHPSAGITSAPSAAIQPKTIAPAHVIPADVSKNMQAALAERQKKLQELSQSSKPSK